MRRRGPTVVLLGMAAKMPVAGVLWQTLHYLVGFERLGYDVFYVEAHARTPTTLMSSSDDDSSALAAAFLARVMGQFGFGSRWAFQALHDDGRCYGLSRRELDVVYREADLLVNLHGGTKPLPEHAAHERLVFLETDPVQVQIELALGNAETEAFLGAHAAFFTFAENYGNPDCLLPVSERFDFRPTRQPVVIDFWDRGGPLPGEDFRTVGNWKQEWLDIEWGGEVYHWSKHHEFLEVLDLPARTGATFELALAKLDEPDRRLLESHGWKTRDAFAFSLDLDSYRAYIQGSRGEFSVAKDQNVRLRTGWFSDRSTTFLAAGRPVVVQDTAFSCALPTGEGLFSFSTIDDAAAAVEAIRGEPERHRRAALDLVREYLSHEVVLGRLLSDLGLRPRVGRSRAHAADAPPFPLSLRLKPVSRHPTELDPETERIVLAQPVPATRAAGRDADGHEPSAAIVVPVRDALACTRMALETVLASTPRPFELVVVDNGSGEETTRYLAELRRRQPNVRVVFNGRNLGFAAAVNQGLELSSGELLVLLNSDVVVTPGWLDGLAAHLEDPAVGMVGPVTNEAGNEARVPAEYETYGELLEASVLRQRELAGRAFEIPMLTMFCVAFRRDVLDRVGPLDERYAIGMFEDDDYSARVREAGFRLVCAEDVLVHHAGKASFGGLVPTGEYAAVFEANRRRFEAKWGREWTPHDRRPEQSWDLLVRDVRGLVANVVPTAATVLVVNRGDESLLELGRRTGWHFPRNEAGEHAGYYPADSGEAVHHVETLRRLGAEYLVFPSTELWWLDHYDELRNYLDAHFAVAGRNGAGVVYSLHASTT